ncbi:MAG: damage-control phosphatase ARMT1 family protein, partial [Caldisericaceae bacterium]
MEVKTECLKCIFNQAYRTAKVSTSDDAKVRQILSLACEHLKSLNFNQTPPEAAQYIYKMVSDISGMVDPYSEIKKEHVRKALRIYNKMIALVNSSEDPLKEAVRVAIVGNAIDMGSLFEGVIISESVLTDMKVNFVDRDYPLFNEMVDKSEQIVFLADNAGETVFDRPLLNLLLERGKKVVYAVKSAPIINDATKEDAVLSSVEAPIVESGSSFAGTVLRDCSSDFTKILYGSDLIIAKGQANYETLSQEKLPVFFLFKV